MSRLSRAEFREAIRRGWSKRCPHCGKGALFIGWNKPYRHCPACGYLYERDYGDVWWVSGQKLLDGRALLRVSLAAAVTPMRGHRSFMAHAGQRGYTGRHTFCPQVTR